MDSLGKFFMRRRGELRLTQKQVAARAGLAPYLISRFENGEDARLSTILKIAAALDLELIPAPRDATSKIRALLSGGSKARSTAMPSSLLELYRVNDDEDDSNA